MIKIGIIGCGKIAQVRHIPEYRENPDTEIYGFYDLNKERAEELALKYGAKAYGSYEELLADGEIDAVSVLTPNFTHAEISIAALRAGKDVLCEKPMATTLEECIAMAETAKETGKTLMIAHNQRLAPAHIKAKELIDAGEIGRPITCHTAFKHSGADNWSVDGANSWFMDKKRSAFGAMADLGIHKLDLLNYLTGAKAVKASAMIGTLDKKYADGTPISVDDNALCTLLFDNGMMGTMHVSWTNYGKEDNSTTICGTKGILHIYKDPVHSVIVEKRGQEDTYYDCDAIQTNDAQTGSGVIDMFVKHLLDGKAPYISAKDVLPAMKTVFACVESNEKDGVRITV